MSNVVTKGYVTIHISIKPEHRQYMKSKHISPSRFMQSKIEEDIARLKK